MTSYRSGCVASPHHLASEAGLAVLRSGGNAVDAAVATNLALSVLTPYSCGPGGDLFAMVWDGSLHAFEGAGATAAAAAGAPGPFDGDAATVPGAVDGWFALLDRFGSRSFEELWTHVRPLAVEGFPVSPHAMDLLAPSLARLRARPEWARVFGGLRAGDVLRQPDLARTFDRLAGEGPDPFYRGEIAAAIVEALRTEGGRMAVEDLVGHRGQWVEPLSVRYRDAEVFELPPPTQGVTALEALRIVDRLGPLPEPGDRREHRLIEAIRAALHDRAAHVTDPRRMRIDPGALLEDARVAERAAAIDDDRAAVWPPARPVPGGTVYLCAADAGGMLVSLIQSNFMSFGTGITVPGWGVTLNNRASLSWAEPEAADAFAPGKKPLHTLIPAMAFRDGRPWLVFGTMGGDGQAQIHVQLLAGILDDGLGVQDAIDRPRWIVSPATWEVAVESRVPAETVAGLERRGHRVHTLGPFEHRMGHAHAVELTEEGYVPATDPRTEGAALGR